MPTTIDRPPQRPPAGPAPRPRPASRTFRFEPLLIDQNPAPGRFKRNLLIVSGVVHLLFFVLLAIMPTRALTILEPSLPISVVFAAAPPPVPEVRAPLPLPKAQPKPAPKPVPERRHEPEPVPVPEPEPAPRPEPPKPPAAKIEPAPPKPAAVVKTNVFGGVAPGPPVVTSKTSRTVIAAFGSAEPESTAPPAPRGRVAEVGFGGEGTSAASPARRAAGNVQKGGFDTETAAAAAPAGKRERPATRLDGAVEILSKPKPVYTEEARRLRIEGDVVLRVTFLATGRLLVLGVAEGLGHGLDEAAIEAAKKIQFTPALQNGQPVDYTATLRVVFRVA